MSSMTFDEFVIQYEPLINKLSHKFYLQNYTVDDIRQEIYLIAWRTLYYYKDDGVANLTNYFIKAVYREMVNFINKQRETTKLDVEQLDKAKLFAIYDDTLKEWEKEEYVQAIWDYLDTTSNGHRARWHFKAGMTQKRIAEIEGVSYQAIGQWLRNIKRKVKKQFPDYEDYI